MNSFLLRSGSIPSCVSCAYHGIDGKCERIISMDPNTKKQEYSNAVVERSIEGMCGVYGLLYVPISAEVKPEPKRFPFFRNASNRQQ